MAIILYHSGKVDILRALHRSDDRCDRVELAFAAVDQDDVGILEAVVFVVREAALQSLSHGHVVVLGLDALHLE